MFTSGRVLEDVDFFKFVFMQYFGRFLEGYRYFHVFHAKIFKKIAMA